MRCDSWTTCIESVRKQRKAQVLPLPVGTFVATTSRPLGTHLLPSVRQAGGPQCSLPLCNRCAANRRVSLKVTNGQRACRAAGRCLAAGVGACIPHHAPCKCHGKQLRSETMFLTCLLYHPEFALPEANHIQKGSCPGPLHSHLRARWAGG